MKDYSFIYIYISSENHMMIKADKRAYEVIPSGLDGAFEDCITDKYKENFIEKINIADDQWFPARIICGEKTPLFYIRASKHEDGIIKLIIVSLDELLDAHNELIRNAASFRAQLDLYEDVYFEYDPETGIVNVFNTDIANFDSGLFSIDEFEVLLCANIPDKCKKGVRSFINQIKSKTGRFSERIEANVLNDDIGNTASFMRGAYIFSKGIESVVGHIHIGNSSGKVTVSSIKHDSLTGLVDKADITRIAQERIDERRLEGTTLAIIDIDYFKNINDTYGHQFGDTVIKRVADIISREVGNSGIVGRFGGDEFVVVFYNIESEESLRILLKAIHLGVGESFADLGMDSNSRITLSIGTATFSKDADNYDDIFMLADHSLYIAKEKGRNRFIIYTPQKHGSLEEIKEKNMTAHKFNDRGEASYGDMLINMLDTILHGPGASVENLMNDFALNFGIQHLALFVGKPYDLRYSTGTDDKAAASSPDMLKAFFNSEAKDKFMAGRDFIAVNRIDNLPPQADAFKAHLREAGVCSFMFICFKDVDQNDCILLVSSIGKYVKWNETHHKYYRAFGDVLACCKCTPA